MRILLCVYACFWYFCSFLFLNHVPLLLSQLLSDSSLIINSLKFQGCPLPSVLVALWACPSVTFFNCSGLEILFIESIPFFFPSTFSHFAEEYPQKLLGKFAREVDSLQWVLLQHRACFIVWGAYHIPSFKGILLLSVSFQNGC